MERCGGIGPLLDYAPPQGRLVVLHRDDAILAVDKPSGLLSVPGKTADLADCLEARVREAFPEALLVHRLDRGASGVMVFARTPRAQAILGKQFERRIVGKLYVAKVAGIVGAVRGLIDLPLAADWPRRPLQKVCVESGKPARTWWRRLSIEGSATRLALRPVTGRSHQLRVHLAEIGHPILGDPFYGDPASAGRLMLHAAKLRLRHPADGRWIGLRSGCREAGLA